MVPLGKRCILHVGAVLIDIDPLSFSATRDRFVQLSKRVKELTIFFIDGAPSTSFPSNVRFVRICVPKYVRRPFRYLFALFKSIFIANKIKHLKIDVFYVLSGFWAQNIGLVLAKITKRPLVIRLRADHWTVRRLRLPRIGRYWKLISPFVLLYDLLQLFTLKHADHIITLTIFLKNKLIKMGIKKEKITTVYPGVNFDLFRPLKKKKHKKKLVICCTSRLARGKGIEYLIEAVRGLHVEVLILGGGERKYVNKLKENAPSNVKFIGYVNHERVPDYINYSDILILPSFSEGLSRSVLEAMACGKPIIATKIPGMNEVGFRGWLVNPGSVTELRKAIMEAAELPEQILKEMGKTNREIIIKKFDWNLTYKSILNIFRKVTKQ